MLGLLTCLMFTAGIALSGGTDIAPGADVPPQADEPCIFFEEIEPAVVTARRARKYPPRPRGNTEWRKHYRLIYNFNAIYAYALVGRDMMAQVDSTIAAGKLDGRLRARYIKDVERELLRIFEKDIWNMTVSQGFLLTRLVDRECEMSAYDIVATYEGTLAAGFWNAVGKLFSQDLRSRYDPLGKDLVTEELVHAWEEGRFDSIYYEVFWEYPVHPYLPTRRLSTSPRQK